MSDINNDSNRDADFGAIKSRSCRMAKPLQALAGWILSNRYTRLLAKVLMSLSQDGISTTLQKVKRKVQ